MPKVKIHFNSRTLDVDFPTYLESKLLSSSMFQRWNSMSYFLRHQHGLWSGSLTSKNQGMDYVYEIPNNKTRQKLKKLFRKHNNRQVVIGVLRKRNLKLFKAMGWDE